MENMVKRKILGLTVCINRNACIATRNCMKIAEEAFELDKERICSFRTHKPKVDRETLIEACQSCPVDALMVIDEQGEQIVP